MTQGSPRRPVELVRLEVLALRAGLATWVPPAGGDPGYHDGDVSRAKTLLRRAGVEPSQPGRRGRGNAALWSAGDVPALQLVAGLDALHAPDQVLEAAARWARSIDPDVLHEVFVAVPVDTAELEPYTPDTLRPYVARAASIGFQLTGRAAWVVHLGRRVTAATAR